MVGFNGILHIGKEEELKMIKDKLVDGKELLVDLLVFFKKLINKGGDSLLHWGYELKK